MTRYTHWFPIAALALVISIGAAGCAKKAPAAAPPPRHRRRRRRRLRRRRRRRRRPRRRRTPKPLTEEEVFAGKTLDQLNAEKPLGDVFFDYDSSTISEEGAGARCRRTPTG